MLRQVRRTVRRRPGTVVAVLVSVALGLAAGFLAPRLLNHEAAIQTTPAVNPVCSAPGPAPDGNDASLDPDPILALPPDLALAPPDGAGYASVRVAELVKSPQYAELRRRIARADPQADQLIEKNIDDIRLLLGLELADVDRAAVVFLQTPPDSQSYVVIVSTAKPYSVALHRIQAALVKIA